MRVVDIPTNRPLIRYDDIDMVYGNKMLNIKLLL